LRRYTEAGGTGAQRAEAARRALLGLPAAAAAADATAAARSAFAVQSLGAGAYTRSR